MNRRLVPVVMSVLLPVGVSGTTTVVRPPGTIVTLVGASGVISSAAANHIPVMVKLGIATVASENVRVGKTNCKLVPATTDTAMFGTPADQIDAVEVPVTQLTIALTGADCSD